MYGEDCIKTQALGQIAGTGKLVDYKSPTLSESIDRRIEVLKAQIAQLELVKAELAKPGGMLNVPIEDLRFALSY